MAVVEATAKQPASEDPGTTGIPPVFAKELFVAASCRDEFGAEYMFFRVNFLGMDPL